MSCRLCFFAGVIGAFGCAGSASGGVPHAKASPTIDPLAALHAEAAPQVSFSLPRSADPPTPSAPPHATPPPVAASPGKAPPAITFSIPVSTAPHRFTTAERETIAACLILEAASQGEFGMRAVMAVIRNRSRGLPELFLPTILRPKQFSALNRVTAGRESTDSAIARARADRMWPVALKVVDAALEDSWHDPTGGATHYTRSAEHTHWTRQLAKTTTIGAHSFYR